MWYKQLLDFINCFGPLFASRVYFLKFNYYEYLCKKILYRCNYILLYIYFYKNILKVNVHVF